MPSARGCFFSFTFSASLVSFASLSLPLPQNCPFVQGSPASHAGNIHAAWFAAPMATHHNSANFAGGEALSAAVLAHPRANPPYSAAHRNARASCPRAAAYDFFNRNSPFLESSLTHRKQTIGLFSIRNKKALPNNYAILCFHFSYLESAPSVPRRSRFATHSRATTASASRRSSAFRPSVQVTLFAQLAESYRPRRRTLLGWISIPRRVG